MMKVGPMGITDSGYGGYGGGYGWDEKGRTKISHIFISCSNDGITSIQFGFVENGVIVLSKLYGSTEHQYFQVVSLNHESEFVTGLKGEYCSSTGYFTSLTFYTNLRTHGPFKAISEPRGNYTKKDFYFKIGDSDEFGGFFGSSYSGRLSSIGFYFTPKLAAVGLNKPVKQENV